MSVEPRASPDARHSMPSFARLNRRYGPWVSLALGVAGVVYMRRGLVGVADAFPIGTARIYVWFAVAVPARYGQVVRCRGHRKYGALIPAQTVIRWNCEASSFRPSVCADLRRDHRCWLLRIHRPHEQPDPT